MDKRIHKANENVVLYPGLVKRLIEKGMVALKKKDGETAYEFFLSAESHEPNHPQILFGKVLSLVELGRLNEAVVHSYELLNEGIGEYYDNLQVHISLLVQLGKYNEVVAILEGVFSESNVPAQFAESFYQLLHFSRQMVGDEGWLNQNEPDMQSIDETIHMLQSSSLEIQSKAIIQLKAIDHPNVSKALVTYLERKDRDLVLQSIALQVLHDKKYDQSIHIEKQGRQMDVIPSQLEDLNQLSFGNDVMTRISMELEHSNPFLFDIAKQLCWAHLLALYPFLPQPEDKKLWAAVFHYCATERLGMEEELNGIEARYQILKQKLVHKGKEVQELEATVYQLD